MAENNDIIDEITDENTNSNQKSNNPKKSKNAKKKRLIYNICIILLAFIFVGSAAYLIKYFWESKKSEERVDELKELIVEDDSDKYSDSNLNTDSSGQNSSNGNSVKIDEFLDVDGTLVLKKFKKLYEMNHDFVGWLTINDMVIDYPVVQRMDENEYYLHKDFDGNYSAAGTLFIDNNCDAAKPTSTLLIYGHNMQSGKMFHTLVNYEKEDFYKQHKYIQFDTIYGTGTYEVIAAFRSKIYDEDYEGFKYYRFFDAKTAEEFDEYIKNCKALTPYTIATSAEYGDALITLSTCEYHVTDGRYVVVAKKIK